MRRSGWVFSTALGLTAILLSGHGPLRSPATADSAALIETITAREYSASPNDDALQAPNRAHDLRTYFDPTGTDSLAPPSTRRYDRANLHRTRSRGGGGFDHVLA